MNAQVLAGFSHFFAHCGDELHCTAHSHHPWPDCTRDAQLQAWLDGATQTDQKWDKVFGEVLPEAQGHIARLLNTGQPQQVAFAPNTHEFVIRLYSCLDFSRPVRVLSTAHEFHSFTRQTRRLAETGRVHWQQVPAEPQADFAERVISAVQQGEWHMVWLSSVLFDSGLNWLDAAALDRITRALAPHTLLVIDGYHAFMALPVDMSATKDRAFYTAGGYKYAMAGEGACFLHVPQAFVQASHLRPVSTGWFADFGALTGPQTGPVSYASDGMRFFGATFDPSALYRLNAVQRWLQTLGITPGHIHTHVRALQHEFLEGLNTLPRFNALLPHESQIWAGTHRGNFVSLPFSDAVNVEERLNAARIRTDRRDARIRFGFGIYHDAAFVARLLERLARL
jgi:selenocysteine lyase/cysteine desulfurase